MVAPSVFTWLLNAVGDCKQPSSSARKGELPSDMELNAVSVKGVLPRGIRQ